MESSNAISKVGSLRSMGNRTCWNGIRSHAVDFGSMVHSRARLHGYEADNKNIKLLRLRSFTIGKPIADDELTGDNAQEMIATLVGVMEPFVSPVPIYRFPISLSRRFCPLLTSLFSLLS
ncbi:hypothetical protein CBS147333_8933 [Penicillium roqueforti]|nr:hypothetical protein CBS147333_8933 [Penicillium roqueforti]KAI3206636.1 hypothetical protein CBS147311_3043 [Penicillium roqueforti]KAI3263484.1 hypothetical protein CBS147308_8595 [Penicillium roqueforti]KAI3281542.1 hypothetical protein DTO003C3_8849 [Penicillium roqueforti]KAI3301384.1 hypothetical protein DTO002I6_574 [Penicillium roqueforti]